MFYMQCNECNERWELGTAITCKCSEKEPLEYSNAVEGWVKISELREHFDSVGCGTIYKTSGEGRVALCVAQPEQEPVGWAEHGVINWLADKQFNHTSFLYDTPPQRTWVGLTDEEIQTEWVLTPQNDKAEGIWFGRRMEAKLKEKNT